MEPDGAFRTAVMASHPIDRFAADGRHVAPEPFPHQESPLAHARQRCPLCPAADDEAARSEKCTVASVRARPDTWPDVPAVVPGRKPVASTVEAPLRPEPVPWIPGPRAEHLAPGAVDLDVVVPGNRHGKPAEDGRGGYPATVSRREERKRHRGTPDDRARAVADSVDGGKHVLVEDSAANGSVKEARAPSAVQHPRSGALLLPRRHHRARQLHECQIGRKRECPP